MTPVTPEDLSGYLDGELPAERAAMIEAELATNEALAAAFAALQMADRNWRTAAGSARFQPAIELPAEAAARPSFGRMSAMLLLLAALALLSRWFDAPELTLLPNVVALVLVLSWVVRMIVAEGAQDMPRAAPVSGIDAH